MNITPWPTKTLSSIVDAFTDEGVARNLAALAHGCVLLDFDECADLGLIADFAAVKIDELGELDVSSQLHVWSDAYIRIHNEVRLGEVFSSRPDPRCGAILRWSFDGLRRHRSFAASGTSGIPRALLFASPDAGMN